MRFPLKKGKLNASVLQKKRLCPSKERQRVIVGSAFILPSLIIIRMSRELQLQLLSPIRREVDAIYPPLVSLDNDRLRVSRAFNQKCSYIRMNFSIIKRRENRIARIIHMASNLFGFQALITSHGQHMQNFLI